MTFKSSARAIAIIAGISKIDVGAKGVLVSFHGDTFADPQGLFAYVDRLNGVAKLRPDNKMVIQRAWGNAEARLNGLVQLTLFFKCDGQIVVCHLAARIKLQALAELSDRFVKFPCV